MNADAEKLPINLTLEIVQLPEPNSHWHEVTGILTWEDYIQRMNTALCTQRELSSLQEAIQFLVGEYFDIRGVKEEYLPKNAPTCRIANSSEREATP